MWYLKLHHTFTWHLTLPVRPSSWKWIFEIMLVSGTRSWGDIMWSAFLNFHFCEMNLWTNCFGKYQHYCDPPWTRSSPCWAGPHRSRPSSSASCTWSTTSAPSNTCDGTASTAAGLHSIPRNAWLPVNTQTARDKPQRVLAWVRMGFSRWVILVEMKANSWHGFPATCFLRIIHVCLWTPDK